MSLIRALAIAICLLPVMVFAQEHTPKSNKAPYASLQSRSIKGLSEADIQELRRGGGWGLALPAELNGKPGPAHLLELSDEIGLTKTQVAALTKIYEGMLEEAILTGERLIAAEAALSKAFENDDLLPDVLARLVKEAEAARADLRIVHLSRHLATTALLTADQIQKYQVLRGYAEDPCSNVPEGHDAEMWKMHNGCR